MNRFFLTIFFLCIASFTSQGSWAEPEKEMIVDFEGRPQRVTYNLFLPEKVRTDHFPVLVCVGGLPMDGDKYIQSDTRECMDQNFQRFAWEHQVAILGIGFLFIPEDWANKKSYQFPKIWSGNALVEVLEELAKTESINPTELYLFGISAGAQFAARFALMRPDITKAVVAHAAGGYDFPDEYIPTKFLITVGAKDNDSVTRVEWAKAFVKAARDKKIYVKLKIISDIGHVQTERQNEMSREFIYQQLRTNSRRKEL